MSDSIFDKAFKGELSDAEGQTTDPAFHTTLDEMDDIEPGEFPKPFIPRTGQPIDLEDRHKFVDTGKRPPRGSKENLHRAWTREELQGETLLNTRDAATLLGLKEDTLATWRRDKLGPPYFRRATGGYLGHVRYRVRDLIEWRDAEFIRVVATKTTQ